MGLGFKFVRGQKIPTSRPLRRFSFRVQGLGVERPYLFPGPYLRALTVLGLVTYSARYVMYWAYELPKNAGLYNWPLIPDLDLRLEHITLTRKKDPFYIN